MRLAYSGLFSFFEKNITVVVPSRLLAAVAGQQFVREQLRLDRESWRRPSVLSLNAWLARAWQEARFRSPDVPALLSPYQENLLWQRILEEEGAKPFDLRATVGAIARAARLVAEWEIPAEAAVASGLPDAIQFDRWHRIFKQNCRRDGWITRAELWRYIPEWAAKNLCGVQRSILLLTAAPFPALVRLQRSLSPAITFEFLERPAMPALVAGKEVSSESEELEYAARWARGMLEKAPLFSIGVFVAGMPARRAEIERVFLDTFYSGSCRVLTDRRLEGLVSGNPLAYRVRPPAPLLEQPIVAGALLLLQVVMERLPVSAAGAILRSRWIHSAEIERSARALADSELRRLRELDVSFSDIESASQRCPELRKILSVVRSRLEALPGLLEFNGWSQLIGDLLSIFGWPGDHDLNADEQAAMEAWKVALSQLGSLSLVADTVSFKQALGQLSELISAGFEPAGGLLAPVQILPLSEVAGLRFDAALATSLGQETWPLSHFPSPFLPLAAQRKHEVPGSSQAQLRSEREILLTGLLSSAPSIQAVWNGRLAPAVRPFVDEKAPQEDVSWHGKGTWQSYRPAILEEHEDNQGPPYQQSDTVRGGTGIIKAQSLCPFRAFAEYRLLSRPLEEGCLGFDVRDRGGHLHTVLQLVWEQLRTFENLKRTSPEDLELMVAESASQAVGVRHDSPFGTIVSSVELERLKQVSLEWLAVERLRLQPFTVETVEEERSITLAGLQLRLRIDRLDRLRNGGLILIDYKSGEPKRAQLACPRPPEPQLLVYAAGIGSDVEGLIFAQLKQRDVRPVGWTRERFSTHSTRTVDTLGDRWEERLEESSREVNRLAEQFKAGNAAVDPLPGACNFCSQPSLCRINERAQTGEAEEA